MDVKNEQRSAIKFCCWLKKSVVEIVKLMHKLYSDEEWLEDLYSDEEWLEDSSLLLA